MSRGTQSSDASRKRRLDRISRIKSEIRRLESKTGKDRGGRNTARISQLKKRLREIGGGGKTPTTYNTKKVEVKTSRGLRIRNKSTEKPKAKKKGMSNIPAGEGTVNNPNFGKKADLSMFKKDKPKPEVKKTEAPKPEVKKESPQTTLKIKPKKMHAIEKRNRKRFGDAHVDKLKKQYADFKAKRKKKKK